MPTVRVVDEYVFYNNSVWDDWQDQYPNIDDNDAVDPTREALYAGEQATGENVTCYGKGLNGVMIDVVGFTGNMGDIDASDFGLLRDGRLRHVPNGVRSDRFRRDPA